MKIGVWLDGNWKPEEGGGYSYYDRLVRGLDNYEFDDNIEIVFVKEGDNPVTMNRPCISLDNKDHTKISFVEKLLTKIPLIRGRFLQRISDRKKTDRKKLYLQTLKNADVKLLYYPIQHTCVLPSFPFIATNWDMGHRSTWTFPEVASDGCFNYREWFYNNVLPRALSVVCESNAGRDELISYTHLNPNRLKVARIFPGETSSIVVQEQRQKEILESLQLKRYGFFYYPAQFWAHKNHYTLLLAYSRFLSNHSDCRLVFTGSDKGNGRYIKSVCSDLGIEDKVVFAGFVSTEIVSTLYQNAISLVMPTLMGPTNMPLLEAMELGCPVICSDFNGHREELEEAAIYVNPLDAEDVCMAMEKVFNNRDEYSKLIMAHNSECLFKFDLFLDSINKIFLETVHLRNCWYI